ncbi:MAG: hypothetical protein ACPLSA_04610 [Caldanaerobacter sp.]
MIAAGGRLIIVKPDEKTHIFNETDGTYLACIYSGWDEMLSTLPSYRRREVVFHCH